MQQDNEKVVLPVDIFNDDHLQELIDNPETYGEVTKNIIQFLGKIVTKKVIIQNPNFSFDYDDFCVRVQLK